MPDGLGNEAAEVLRVAGEFDVRGAEDGDAVGEREAVGRVTFGEGTAFVETEEAGLRGQVFDDEQDIAEAGAIGGGDAGDGVFDDAFKCFESHAAIMGAWTHSNRKSWPSR